MQARISKTSPPTKLTSAFLERCASRKPLRAGSVIVTIFGDTIAPRGGVVWLGSLIRVLEPLGISERVVRTAVYRLSQDGVLASEQIGRKSYYGLTESGREQFAAATQRIYRGSHADWDGRWCLVLTSALSTTERAAARKALGWQGFGQFGAELLAHPNADRGTVATQLQVLGVETDVVLLDATSPKGNSTEPLNELVNRAWDLPGLARAYDQLLDTLTPLDTAVRSTGTLEPADAFYARTLLIHEYRRVLLRDPSLPAALLPTPWPGRAAAQLSRALYRALAAPAERFVDGALSNSSGALPRADRGFTDRFGGLGDVL